MTTSENSTTTNRGNAKPAQNPITPTKPTQLQLDSFEGVRSQLRKVTTTTTKTKAK